MMRSDEFPWEVLNHIPIGIFVLDTNGNYCFVNDAYCSMSNKPRDFFDGASIPQLQRDGYLTSTVWEQVVATRKPVASVITITDETQNRSYDALTIGTPLLHEDGSIRFIIYRQETMERLMSDLQKGMQNRSLFRNESNPEDKDLLDRELIAESPQMKQIVNMLSVVSKSDVSILVTGPSGTGKEVLSKYIHSVSDRRGGPLMAINCAAIPENLLESELFGYEKGAFTGALKEGKQGLIESADGGTLFLDEINSMSPAVQVRLLRVLETKQIMRIGSTKSKKVDFRLVCASNEDLQMLVDQKLFRSDLFYRINVISVSIPPLKDRKEDITALAMHFLDVFCKKYGRVMGLSSAAIEQLRHYDWPGNVRELRNMIERAVVTAPNTEWEIHSFPLPVDGVSQTPEQSPHLNRAQHAYHLDEEFSLRSYLDTCEKNLLLDLLNQGFNAKMIAKILKLNISNVYRKMQKYQIG